MSGLAELLKLVHDNASNFRGLTALSVSKARSELERFSARHLALDRTGHIGILARSSVMCNHERFSIVKGLNLEKRGGTSGLVYTMGE